MATLGAHGGVGNRRSLLQPVAACRMQFVAQAGSSLRIGACGMLSYWHFHVLILM